ncbi:MAG: hypothetical protein QXH35_08795 [Nitrososphaerota archaeon]
MTDKGRRIPEMYVSEIRLLERIAQRKELKKITSYSLPKNHP